ncbi:MAG: hypothetical protein KGJ07_02760 [Patescibacteria group bacterium]|nr:hypothetical protein [Patescibacteria group bacterium]MDE2588419.1 hypothetical protein [Patescibacteria group bacterium]
MALRASVESAAAAVKTFGNKLLPQPVRRELQAVSARRDANFVRKAVTHGEVALDIGRVFIRAESIYGVEKVVARRMAPFLASDSELEARAWNLRDQIIQRRGRVFAVWHGDWPVPDPNNK